jgi:hypothetical protein
MSWNDEPKIGHPEPGRGANEAPTSAPAPPAPDPRAGTLPGSSVPVGELERAANDAFAAKGLCTVCGGPSGHSH